MKIKEKVSNKFILEKIKERIIERECLSDNKDFWFSFIREKDLEYTVDLTLTEVKKIIDEEYKKVQKVKKDTETIYVFKQVIKQKLSVDMK